MASWLLDLVAHDFSSNPTAWIDLLITLLSLAAAPITWLFTRKHDAKSAAEAQARFEQQLETEREQVSALQQQVEALREANRIAVTSDPTTSDPLSDAKHVKGMLFNVTNLSNRTIVVTDLHAVEHELLIFDGVLPVTLGHGETITFGMAYSGNAAISWHWEHDTENKTHISKRRCDR